MSATVPLMRQRNCYIRKRLVQCNLRQQNTTFKEVNEQVNKYFHLFDALEVWLLKIFAVPKLRWCSPNDWWLLIKHGLGKWLMLEGVSLPLLHTEMNCCKVLPDPAKHQGMGTDDIFEVKCWSRRLSQLTWDTSAETHSCGLFNSKPLESHHSLPLISFSLAFPCCFFSRLLLFWPANCRFSEPWTIAVTLLWELRNSLTEGLGFKQMPHHISVILRHYLALSLAHSFRQSSECLLAVSQRDSDDADYFCLRLFWLITQAIISILNTAGAFLSS